MPQITLLRPSMLKLILVILKYSLISSYGYFLVMKILRLYGKGMFQSTLTECPHH